MIITITQTITKKRFDSEIETEGYVTAFVITTKLKLFGITIYKSTKIGKE